MTKKILCIEDNRIMQNIYKRMIDKLDFADEVVPMYNGKEALDYYKGLLDSGDALLKHGEAPGTSADVPGEAGETDSEGVKRGGTFPDLIFLDLNMPVMNGWSFLKEFDKLDLDVRVKPYIVVVSSSVDPEDRKRASQYPVGEFLTKPLTFEMLKDLEEKLDGN